MEGPVDQPFPRRKRQSLPTEPVRARVESMSHDGRGVARVQGKPVFIEGALPGEEVEFVYTAVLRRYDEAQIKAILQESPLRVEPRCPHFPICGGCSLQHLDPEAQIWSKQQVLLDNLRKIASLQPDDLLPPVTGPAWGYRRKARLGVKHVPKKGRVLVGFREKRGTYVAEIESCEVLHARVGRQLMALADLIGSLSIRSRVPQIEVAMGDEVCALVFRTLESPSAEDREKILAFAEAKDFDVYLQPSGVSSVKALTPSPRPLTYRLPEHGVELRFKPMDFTQVNLDVNRILIDQAIRLLDPQPEDQFLDLFCGLGNFTLPIARRVAQVIGIEGDAALIARAEDNAKQNGIENVTFHRVDLSGDLWHEPWMRESIDKVLVDPPRSGAMAVMKQLRRIAPARILYISCNPATLARDAEHLVHQQGYRLASAGVMDMFPHTSHVESIALFQR
jgi:23S rRNA (uracil1939-C5)-methyltransferase